jgi:tripeptidyl-peptidase-1
VIGCKNFHPSFPASSPHVTSVGGTYFPARTGAGKGVDDGGVDPEVCWASSGGGFSNVFAMPEYQQSSVAPYLHTSNLPAGSRYNASGRATPDVAAVSTNFQVLINNYTGPISGTSAATPTFAGIVSLINAIRLEKGKPTIGFLNYARCAFFDRNLHSRMPLVPHACSV